MDHKYLGRTQTQVPVIGQGTMGVGGYYTEDSTRDEFYIRMLRKGMDSGLTFIDTAEAYGCGHSEVLVGRAIKNRRKDVFLATKVSPENLSFDSVLKAIEGSLNRLQTDYIDLYQIHWPNPAIPIEETLDAMELLRTEGKVRYVGVCNFSVDELKLANTILKNKIVSNQVEYNLFDRTAEEDILPYCEKEKITLIAYSPLDKGNINTALLQELSIKYNKTPAQIILKWITSRSQVIAIPKSANIRHIEENASISDFNLSANDTDIIDRIFQSTVSTLQLNEINVNRTGWSKFAPTAEDLAESIRRGAVLKPIRVKKINNSYELVEGKVRYWAQVIASGGKGSVRALIR